MTTKYKQNLDKFINNLPLSNVRYLYFSEYERNGQKILEPTISKTARVWNDSRLKAKPLYVIGTENTYCYIYKHGGLKYDIHLDSLGNVEGFTRQEGLAHSNVKSTIGGNTTSIETQFGDHYTVGIEQNQLTEDWMFMNHITRYKQSKIDPLKYVRYAEHCNMKLTDHIKKSTNCLNSSGRVIGTLENYEKYENDYDIIPILQTLYKKIAYGPSAGGENVDSVTTVKYKKKQYTLHTGPKGGHYILYNGRKVYLQKGGAQIYETDGFTETFIRFIHDYRILPITQQERLKAVILIDDEESEYTMLRYNTGREANTSILYAIPKIFLKTAFEASQVPQESRTSEQHRVLEDIQKPMIPIHAIRVSVH